MQYVTYGDLFTFVLMIIALLTLSNNWNRKKRTEKSGSYKNNCP